jgi:endogenous inhibitor of DNA gyrase (YacG/DUF329 family)
MVERLSTYKTCPVCGRELPKQKSTGRPRVFCDTDCRRLDQILGWLEDQLGRVDPTSEKKKSLRRRLWYLANQLNAKSGRSGDEQKGEARE